MCSVFRFAHRLAILSWRVIQERDENNTPLVSYTRGSDLSGSFEGAGGIGGLLARTCGYSSGNWSTNSCYFADGNGNIVYMLDGSQSMVASYRYDPFGHLMSASGSLVSDNSYRFSSKEIIAKNLDQYGALYYYGYRFYDPYLQRWINRDPVGDAAETRSVSRFLGAPVVSLPRAAYLAVAWVGENDFSFNRNGPINLVDPLGLQSLPPGYQGPGKPYNPSCNPFGPPAPPCGAQATAVAAATVAGIAICATSPGTACRTALAAVIVASYYLEDCLKANGY